MAAGCRPPAAVRENVSGASLTTLGVGGPVRYVVTATSRREMIQCLEWARATGLPTVVLGEGSNVLIADSGFPGLVVVNRLGGRRLADGLLEVASGENLTESIRWTNRRGYSGWERMIGIPGTVGGAVVGNAGAYGQEIGERVVAVDVWTPEGVGRMAGSELGFTYRDSVFKRHPDWVVLSVSLGLDRAREDPEAVSEAILREREQKYPRGLRCPGSFFKNIPVASLSESARRRIPEEFVHFGKIPAGRLLQAAGACGRRRGDAMIATYHGNLFLNLGRAAARDLVDLAREAAEEVWRRFGVRLEPEVVLIGEEWPAA
ncbi:MAG: UDP-N-acetylmuramate dehydrogenase [Acidobacteriota bacterium]